MFCQKIARHFINQGYEIIWPVIPEFAYIGKHIKDISFPLITDDFFGKEYYSSAYSANVADFLYLPIQDADRHFPSMLIMDSKYKMAGLSHENWQGYLAIERDIKKETELYEKLNPEKEPYIFVNKNFGSPPGYKTINYTPVFDGKVIEMNFKEKFNIFHWIKILENAKEIHTVDTALSYIIEVSPSVNCPLYLYSRYEPRHFNQTKHLFSKNWNYVL
jgi:hypothetical protein